MRKLIITLLVIAAIVAAGVIYVLATIPSSSAGVKFPLDDNGRAMIAHVPDSAEAFALIPAAAALDAKMRANPVTRGAIESWNREQRLPRPWMLGSADLLAWRTGEGKTRYYVRLDPLRAMLVRAYAMVSGDSGNAIFIDAPAEQTIDPAERDRILALSDKLPSGDAFVVQRRSSRGAFPPIARPAASSIRITAEEIDITSRAETSGTTGAPLVAHFPQRALLTTAFSSAPRIAGDLNRLFGADIAKLFEAGGEIAVYDVELGKLLPRPLCVFAVPDDAPRQEAVQRIQSLTQSGESLGIHAEVQRLNGRILLSFDRSLAMYLKDAPAESRWPSARWAAHADPARFAPILDDLSNNLGLRIATPRIFRSARDVDRWIAALQQARSIDAVDSDDGIAEELRVVIRSPS